MPLLVWETMHLKFHRAASTFEPANPLWPGLSELAVAHTSQAMQQVVRSFSCGRQFHFHRRVASKANWLLGGGGCMDVYVCTRSRDKLFALTPSESVHAYLRYACNYALGSHLDSAGLSFGWRHGLR